VGRKGCGELTKTATKVLLVDWSEQANRSVLTGSDDEPNVGRGFRGRPGGRLVATGASGSTTFLGRPGPRLGAVVVLRVSGVLFGRPRFRNGWWVDGMCSKTSMFSVRPSAGMFKQ